jgi:hypothetical protein
MGGSIGVSVLGAVLAHQVADGVAEGMAEAGIPADRGHATGAIPDLATLPDPIRQLFEHAFGEATGHIFLVATPIAVLALVCVLFIREVPLRTTVLRADELAPEVAAEVPVEARRS